MPNKHKPKNTVTIGPKHQVVIPKEVRKKCHGMNTGSKVNVYSLDGQTIIISPVEDNWAEKNLGGLKDFWQGIDPIKELKKIRNEWKD